MPRVEQARKTLRAQSCSMLVVGQHACALVRKPNPARQPTDLQIPSIEKTDGAHQTYQLTLFSCFGYSWDAPASPASVQPTIHMHSFLSVFGILLQIVLIAALADFVAGFIHWIEDAYFTEHTPVIGPAFIRPNILHHHQPRYFTRLSWWQSSKDLLFAGVA